MLLKLLVFHVEIKTIVFVKRVILKLYEYIHWKSALRKYLMFCNGISKLN